MTVKTKEEQYELYGRKEYVDPLQFVKSVPGGELEDLETGDEWVELIAFPASAAVQVIPWEGNDEREE